MWKRFFTVCLSLGLFACETPTTENEADNPEVSTINSTLQYEGITEDFSPADFDGGADGEPDHEFVFTHNFDGEVTLRDVTLSRVESGTPNGIAGWTTTDTIQKYWILKVQHEGRTLNGDDRVSNLEKQVSEEVTFRLFGSDARGYGLTASGTEYELRINYVDASDQDRFLRKRVRL